MDHKKIKKLFELFESAALIEEEDNIEFWHARDLQQLFGYTRWENFEKVVDKAKEATHNSGAKIDDHFLDVRKKVSLGSGAEREIIDTLLTRYAAYLVAQNGDSRKEEVAFAQAYFAMQTRKHELLVERLKANKRLRERKKLMEQETKLSQHIFERGVDQRGFSRIRSKGDQKLFGGLSTRQTKINMKVPKNRPLADFLPTVTIIAKSLAAEISNINIEKKDLFGEYDITIEHEMSNINVRETLLKSGIVPEDLPPAEDIKKVERRLKSGDKKALNEVKKMIDQRKKNK